MTGYSKVVSTTSSDAALGWYARGGLHISSGPCEGVAYHSELMEVYSGKKRYGIQEGIRV